jgi:hypothetical protein
MEYDLTRLDHEMFSDLARELIRNLLGVEVKPIGEQSTGRTSMVSSRLAWPAGSNQQIWEGATYVRTILLSSNFYITDSQDKIYEIIENELESLDRYIELRIKHGEKIQNLFYICNVDLDSSTGSPYEAKIKSLINAYPTLGITACKVWDFRQICQVLDKQEDVRRKFAGFILPQDALSHLSDYFSLTDPGFGDAITRQLSMDLLSDQWIRLGQVGLPNHQKLALSSVAIDLPVQSDQGPELAAAHILSIGNRSLRPDKTKSGTPPHLVLVGGPGQGKTTIGQLVSQVYRSDLLSPGPQLSSDVSSVLNSMNDSVSRVGLGRPANRRWPVRIELAAYADDDTKNNLSLLRYIADQVGLRSSDTVQTHIMREWLKCWPWLLVLDGLDEVPSQRARDSLMQRVSDFFVEAAQARSDLLVVATTRPQGYTGEFSADRYEHMPLISLEPAIAASYAQRLAEVQHASDPDLLQKVIDRTRMASQEESTARLMRTPLQVTIMSLLLENRERAPRARYSLFEAYYQAIYTREATKPGRLGEILETLRTHINALHNRIGLLLQVKAEHEGELDAALPQEDLRKLAVLRLTAEGYSDKDADKLAEQVLNAVTHRLVLLVPKALDEVGFEVRSIQEFMAARALVSGRDEAILSRMSLLVSSAHWRNTSLFAAGRIFFEREHLRRDLITEIEDTDSQDVLNVVVAPGADLALDMLDDDLAIGTPGLQRALVRHALTLLRCPPDEDLKRRAGVFYRCASDAVVRAAIDQAIGDALRGSPLQQSAANQLLESWQAEIGGLGLKARQIIASQKIAEARKPQPKPWEKYREERRPSIFEIIDDVLDEENLNQEHRRLVDSAIQNIFKDPHPKLEGPLAEALYLPECASAMSKVVLGLGGYPANAAKLRIILRNWNSRRPVGPEVLQATPFLDTELSS